MPDIGRVEPPDSLEHLEIMFETGDDDKDRDTAVLVELLARDDRLLATYFHAQQPDLRYPNQGYAYERLEIQGAVTPADTLGSRIRIKIEPTGNDTWKFTWHLLYRWASGSLLHSTRISAQLDERNREAIWPVNIQPRTGFAEEYRRDLTSLG